ncbi:hypothetical protein LTR04_005018 [Oleoguttula sp. CCFEE 6159]|nr:hypothetical protein LTR04_005018 [Oleoguttula sp. CCFEE 6159]
MLTIKGYIFIAPYQVTQNGPYIYDKFGNLIWDGSSAAGPGIAHDFKVCQYKGSDHLCLYIGNQQEGYAHGVALILDSNYRVVQSVQTGNNVRASDMHDFQLLNDGQSALLTAYQSVPADLSNRNITGGQGWILEGVFQEVNVTDGSIIFEWMSLNHVDPSASYVAPNTTDTSGNGLSASTAWDYFHINSVDKSPSGNYLVSARHTSSIYYVNGTDRSTIWTLSAGGASTFACTNFNFSFQHDARIISENDTTTVISMFDNASNGYNISSSQSSGKIITIDTNAKTATLMSHTTAPVPNGLLSSSQGNSQLLSNGGIFLGWGSWASFSEHSPNGTAVFFADFGKGQGFAMNYRAFSYQWISTPANTKPDVYSYAKTTNDWNALYVSWNGATTVKTWRFYGAQNVGDTFEVLGNATWAGFETMFRPSAFYMWTFVEALASDGTSLRNSSLTPTNNNNNNNTAKLSPPHPTYETVMDEQMEDAADVAQETPRDDVFMPPSIDKAKILAGRSYSHFTPIPSTIAADMSTECVLGVDEAGRGPVLGPMVYALLYLPLPAHRSLLATTHHFDDSKVLTPTVRSSLMRTLCTASTDLHAACGWATAVMSARDIAAGQLRATGSYNLNAQAMDATVALIQGVLDRGVNVTEIYVDTVGPPLSYQRRLERVFPAVRITVAKKADSLFPCVSAASVCAKVTRDAALEVCWESYATIHASDHGSDGKPTIAANGWGSGYPSDARCSTWLKRNIDPVFGWGNECRFSWSTAKELLEAKNAALKVEWPVEDEDDGLKVTDFFTTEAAEPEEQVDELAGWYGKGVSEMVF